RSSRRSGRSGDSPDARCAWARTRISWLRGSGALPHPTATSKAGRARAGARTSSRRWWRRRPRSAEPCPVRATSRGSTDMEKFTTHTGVAAALKRSNVDTDQIIPAVFLKRVTKTGFEDALFHEWRKDPE